MRLPSPCWSITLVAALPAQVGGRELQADVQRALDRARPVLLEQAANTEGGQLALVCLAMVHDGVPRDDATFRAAIERLARAELDQTYPLALRLMVAQALPEFPDRERVAGRDVERLLRHQHGGGFGYSSAGNSWDLSNTQYAALGLRAAHAISVQVPRAAWRALAVAVARMQRRGGGFGYHPSSSSSDATSSMTVAGIAVLEICRQQLPATALRGIGIGKRIAAAWKWLAANRADIGNPAIGWSYYFHYGLERAAILSGVDEVGGVEWYPRGAAMLLRQQLAGGGWNQSAAAMAGSGPERAVAAEPVGTAFAVLFLRRKFQRQLTPVTLGGGYLTRGLPEQATEQQIERAIELDVARGRDAVPDLLRALRSPIGARRRAGIAALTRVVGQDFGYLADAPPAARSRAATAAERWWLTEGRKK